MDTLPLPAVARKTVPPKKAGWIGIDTGGTFTDVVSFGPDGLLRESFKLPSEQLPQEAIVAGLEQAGLERYQLSHGTTVATNALLERRGSNIALVTTSGFGDILVVGRGTREQLYSLSPSRRPPLVDPSRCFEVVERVASDGTVLVPLEPEAIARLGTQLKASGVTAVAVCFLFSFMNPSHEEAVGQHLARLGFAVSLSHRICPEYREYERASTTALNAYLQGPLRAYLEPLGLQAKKRGASHFWVVHSGGAVVTAAEACESAILSVLSGPAAGVRAACHLAAQAGHKDIITFDMGGTSTDVALCSGGLPLVSEGLVDGFPVRQMMVDIHTVGAGGGSLAGFDEGGALWVGPRSAGSSPGPAAYGRSFLPTVTDAHVVLGRLPLNLAGGRLALHPERSHQALAELGKPHGLSSDEVAQAIVEVANVHMEKALRLISVERGHDPRRFTLVAYGGAGPIHAAELADRLNCRRVLVCPQPGLLCALGASLSPWQREFSVSVLQPLAEVDDWDAAFERLEAQCIKAARTKRVRCKRLVDLRYRGQGSSLTLPYGPNLEAEFHRLYERSFSYRRVNVAVEVVSLRVRGELARQNPKPVLARPRYPVLPQPGILSWDGVSLKCPQYLRENLGFEEKIAGPALIFQADCTTLIPPRWTARVDKHSNLVLEKN